TIVGAFQPSLSEFSKINVKPEAPKHNFSPQNLQFSTLDKVISTQADLELISPDFRQPTEKQNTFRNYVKAGIGTNISPLFLFQHHSKLSKETSFDFGIQHLSSWTTIPDYAPSDWMKNQFSTDVKHAFTDHILHTGLTYNYNTNRYYGFKPEDFPSVTILKDTIAQKYQNIGFHSELASNYKDVSKLHHAIGVNYNYFSDYYKAREHFFELNGQLRKDYEWFDFDGTQTTALEVVTGYYANSDSLNKTNNFFFGALPSLTLKGSFYEVQAGVRMNFLNDTSSHFYVYPKISGKLLMFDQKLAFFAGIDGNSNRSNLFEITDINPFLMSGQQTWWTNSRFIFDAGFKTAVIKNLDLYFGLRFEDNNSEGFYVTDTSTMLKNTYTVVYDDLKEMIYLAQASYKLSNKLLISTLIEYSQREMTNLSHAWNKANFEMNVKARYQFDEKLNFSTEMFFQGKRYAPTYINGIETAIELKPVADINIISEYAINQQFAVFAQVNNLLHDKYERFHNYPVQGIQLIIGMNLKF
ncbi:MAG: hypothetical protein Q8T08_07820, partial [Ignavibacteria bacterium]|nr:hypothetical protein [Ignavibacteria bacterium]